MERFHDRPEARRPEADGPAVNGPGTRRSRGRAGWFVIAGCLLAAAPSRADDDVVVEERLIEPGNGRVHIRINRNATPNMPAQYDWNVFGVFESMRMQSLEPASKVQPQQLSPRDRAALIVEDVLRRIDAVVGLTEPQRGRLRQAIDVDLIPVIEHIEADRQRYGAMPPPNDHLAHQETNARLHEDALASREMLTRSFDADSLLQKTLPTTLEPQQFDRLNSTFAARRAGRWTAAVAVGLERLDETLGLTTEQHDALERVLLERQPKLRVLLTPSIDNSNVRFHLVCIELAALDEDILKALVNERQWAALEGWRQQGRVMQQHFVKQGWYEP